MKKYPFWALILSFILTFSFQARADVHPLKEVVEKMIPADSAGDLSYALLLQDLSTGEVVFAHNAELPLNPASNTKVLSSLVALALLGPDFTFKTQFLVIPGKEKNTLFALTLKGFGDPFFSSSQLQQMVRQLKDKGIQKIEHLYIDGTFFDNETFPGQMEGRQKDAYFNCSVGAVSIDHNFLEIVVEPEEKNGKAAKVTTHPALPHFPIQQEVSTQTKGGKIIVRNKPQFEGDLTVSVKGAIALKAESQSYKISIHQPAKLASLHFMQALKNEGLEVPDSIETQAAPFGSLMLIENKSAPLLNILQEMNKQSDNFIAEQITKFLGAKFMGPPGSSEKGTQVILKKLKEMEVSVEGLQLENGSGLSRLNRMTVQTLSQSLLKTYKDIFLRANFISTLSVLGVDGTLRKKFKHSELAGRFFGKTGTLNGVTALTGYVFPKSYEENHKAYVYSYIINGNGKDFWKLKQNFQDILELMLNL